MKKAREVFGNALIVLLVLGMATLPALAAEGKIRIVSRVPPQIAPDTAGGGEARTSADGRYVAFNSFAPNLIPGQVDRSVTSDVFLYDRVTGTTVLVSHVPGAPATAGNDYAGLQEISADGNWIVFYSPAGALVEGVENDPSTIQLYLFERATGRVTLISRRAPDGQPGNGPSAGSSISADGSFVAFWSGANDLTAAPVDKRLNVYLFERATGAVTLISHAASSPSQGGNDESFTPVLSADGRFVAYYSKARDLVAGQVDPTPSLDLFLYDRMTGANTLVTHASASALRAGNNRTDDASAGFSADGRFLAYASNATDLAAGVADTNGRPDVFLYDRLTNTSSLVGRSAESPSVTSPLGSRRPIISADGSTIAFLEASRNLQSAQAFVFDRLAGTSKLVTRSAAASSSSSNAGTVGLDLSADGRYLLLASLATDLVPGQVDVPGTPDVFLHDRVTGNTILVSHADGSPARAGDRESGYQPDLSADGSLAVYASAAGDLDATKRDSNLAFDTFVFERATGVSRVISLHTPGAISRTANDGSSSPAISVDGRYVVYQSLATNLIPGQVDRNNVLDVFLYDRDTKKTVLVSRSASSTRTTANALSTAPQISRDGSFVLFSSKATNLVAGQRGPAGEEQVFLFNRKTGTTVLVSHASASPARMANQESYPGGLSADGSIVAFSSQATDLTAGQKDRNQRGDVFLYDSRTSAVTLVSHISSSPVQTGNGVSWFSSMSLDGEWIGITSYALNLTPGVPSRPDPYGDGGYANAYLFERRTGAVTLISKVGPVFGGMNPVLSADGRFVAYMGDGIRLLDRTSGRSTLAVRDPDGQLDVFGLSDDGRWLLFSSYDAGIVPGQLDANDQPDVFLFDAASGKTRLVSHLPGSPVTTGISGAVAESARLSADGRWVVFLSFSPDMLPEPPAPGAEGNVFRYDRLTEEVDLVSRSSVSPERPGDRSSYEPQVSATGNVIAFTSFASDLVSADFNLEYSDVFLFLPEEE